MELQSDNLETMTTEIEIHKTRDVSDLIVAVSIWLEKNKNIRLDKLDFDSCTITLNGLELDAKLSLQDSSVKDGSRVIVILKNQSRKVAEEVKATPVANKNQLKDLRYPSAPEKGYVTKPSFDELLKLDKNALQKVKDFEIANEFGRVLFPGLTDLTGVDLAKEVKISHRQVEIYDDQTVDYPQKGDKLNRPAEVTLLKMQKPQKYASVQEWETSYKENIERNGGSYLGYNVEKREISFKVPGF